MENSSILLNEKCVLQDLSDVVGDFLLGLIITFDFQGKDQRVETFAEGSILDDFDEFYEEDAVVWVAECYHGLVVFAVLDCDFEEAGSVFEQICYFISQCFRI